MTTREERWAQLHNPAPQPPGRRRYWWHPIHPDFLEALDDARSDSEIWECVFRKRMGRLASRITRHRDGIFFSAAWSDQERLARLAGLIDYDGPVIVEEVRA